MNDKYSDIEEKFGSDTKKANVKIGRLSLVQKISTAVLLIAFFGMWYLYNSIYVTESQSADEVSFMIEKGESINHLAERLEDENIIKNKWLFKKYLVFKGVDKKVQAGSFTVTYPITLSRVVNSLQNAIAQNERIITIIPGWTIRDMADYFVKIGLINTADELYGKLGKPAFKYSRGGAPKLDLSIDILEEKPEDISYEGYLAPNTYRIFEDAALDEVLEKLVLQQDKIITNKMYDDIKKTGYSLHEILTMASIIEREVRTVDEKAKVSDIFWKRYKNGWALQADSTVHYVTGEKGDLFTTSAERDIDNPWNTYEFPGLPPGPISAPSLESIKAAIYPKANNYWYFLTTLEGEVKYATDLDGHNKNVHKYLR